MQKTLMAACLAALAVPGFAMADDHYLRGGFAQVEPDSTLFDDDSQGFTLGVGWRFTDHFAVEAGYNDFGDYEGIAPGIGGPMDLATNSLELGLAAKLPFGDSNFFGQARVGAHRWENKFHNFENEAKDTGTDAYYGVGLGYQIAETFDVVLNYERYAISDDSVGDIDRVMLSFELR